MCSVCFFLIKPGVFLRSRLCGGTFLAAMFAAEECLKIRTRLLENVCSRVHPNLHADFGRRLVRGPVIRVVCIRNCTSRGVAQPLRVIWLNMARVSARYEPLRKRIPQPCPAASSAAPEISGILMQGAGKEALRHIVA